jgi:hypothetical protein
MKVDAISVVLFNERTPPARMSTGLLITARSGSERAYALFTDRLVTYPSSLSEDPERSLQIVKH